MGLLAPVIKVEYQNTAGNQFGLTDQPSHVSGDDIGSLTTNPLKEVDGLHFEQNTGRIILAPVLRPRDFGLAQTPNIEGLGLWKDVLDTATNKRALVQYSGAESIAWGRGTDDSFLDFDNQPFSIGFYFGAPPKATPDNERNATGVFRSLVWPTNAASGENQWKLTIPYQEAPYLERSTDGGSTFVRETTLDTSVDMETLRTSRNPRITFSVITIGNQMVCWLGEGFKQGGKVIYKNAGYRSGGLKVSGKGGYTKVDFNDIRFKQTGHLISYRHDGPFDMETPTPEIHIHGTKKDDLDAASQTMVGTIENTYPLTYEYEYRLAMTSPALGAGESDYSATTPYAEQINVVWPLIETHPVDEDFTEIQILQYHEKASFDPSSRILRRFHNLTGRVYGLERNPAHGVESVRVSLGYQHELDNGGAMTQRGIFVANTEAHFFSLGRDAFVTYDGYDFFWFLEPQYLKRKIFPSKWCVYSLVRLLLEMGGIVPEWYQKLPRKDQTFVNGAFSPAVSDLYDPDHLQAGFCEFGPNPEDCPHTKMPFHPGWIEFTPILACLDEVKDVEFAWLGQDETGQFRFEPFDIANFTAITKAFFEGGSGDGSLYDEIGTPGRPFLERTRSVSGVKNDISFTGNDETTGANFVKHYRDEASIKTRSAVNYTASARPYSQASSVFVDEAFTQEALDKVAKWARLPYEAIAMEVNGQPTIFPLNVIQVTESRSLGGFPVAFLVTDVDLNFSAPGTFTSTISALWNGLGSPPGVAPARPPKAQVVLGDVGSIPPDARRRRGTVQTGTAA